jgi:undecaprenyl diphosphate synthase
LHCFLFPQVLLLQNSAKKSQSELNKGMNKIPNHLGIIIDGNRRWAKARNLPSFEGHRKGFNKLRDVGKWCKEKGVKILTIYAFSTENWNRSEKEVNYLMRLLAQALAEKEIQNLMKNGIKLNVIGQIERLPKHLQTLIKSAEQTTENNKEGVLNLAISYGGRAEIVQAVKRIVKEGITADKICEETIEGRLWTKDLADPDLIIRTAGEQRLSNFLLWQIAYSELYFTKKYWPDFEESDLEKAFRDYTQRQRRYGK